MRAAEEQQVRERPILFSAPMVRAILEGRKTQTRRVVKFRPTKANGRPIPEQAFVDKASDGPRFAGPQEDYLHVPHEDGTVQRYFAPYGSPGGRLWVRETWAESPDGDGILYRATDHGWDDNDSGLRWRPSIFMKRNASRLALEVTKVRVEVLGQMAYHDALDEGIYQDSAGFHWKQPAPTLGWADPRHAFADLWDAVNGKGAVNANPWVWVVEFKRVGA